MTSIDPSVQHPSTTIRGDNESGPAKPVQGSTGPKTTYLGGHPVSHDTSRRPRGLQRAHLPQALLPVGKDCDCGHPLVWWNDKPRCSVYGSHPTIVYYRNIAAPAHRLVRDVAALDRRRLRAVS